MSLNLSFARVASTIAMTAAALVGATEARAAEEPRCRPTAEMKTHLNSIGQVGLIAFEQQGSDPSKYVLRAIYATPTGDRATELVGEMQRDIKIPANRLQLPPVMCKDGEYTDVKLSMNSLRVIPKSFFETNVTIAEADLVCKQRQWGGCGPYNLGMESGAQKSNHYPMLKMTSAQFRSDGSIAKRGANYTISANPVGDRSGVVESGFNGVSQIFYDITNASYLSDSKMAFSNNWPIVVAEISNRPNIVAFSGSPTPK